jgi:hypothetical protein
VTIWSVVTRTIKNNNGQHTHTKVDKQLKKDSWRQDKFNWMSNKLLPYKNAKTDIIISQQQQKRNTQSVKSTLTAVK